MKSVIFGRNSIAEAAKSGIILKKLFLLDQNKKKFNLKQLLQNQNVKIINVPKRELDKICKTDKHGGVAAEADVPGYVPFKELLKIPEKKQEEPFFLVLDQIQDPNNFGAIIRSAEGAGVHGIITSKRNSAPITPAVIKTSTGAAYHVPIAAVPNLVQTLKTLKDKNIWIFGAENSGSINYQVADLRGAIALVIGSEGKGLRRLTEEACDYKVQIPMMGKVNSLNASVSAGILLYEIRRQRNLQTHTYLSHEAL